MAAGGVAGHPILRRRQHAALETAAGKSAFCCILGFFLAFQGQGRLLQFEEIGMSFSL